MTGPGAKGAGGDAGNGPERRDIERRRDELLKGARESVAESAAHSAAHSAGETAAASGEGASGTVLAGLGLQFVVMILLCLYAGMWLDKKLGTAPWLLILGMVVGASTGFYVLYTVMMRENARAEDNRKHGIAEHAGHAGTDADKTERQ